MQEGDFIKFINYNGDQISAQITRIFDAIDANMQKYQLVNLNDGQRDYLYIPPKDRVDGANKKVGYYLPEVVTPPQPISPHPAQTQVLTADETPVVEEPPQQPDQTTQKKGVAKSIGVSDSVVTSDK